VTKELLRWARITAGLTEEQLASKLQTTVERVRDFENGVRRPSVPQAKKWARITRRAFVLFYLEEVPKDFSPLKDFRRAPGADEGEMSPALRFEIREAYEQREVFLELREDALDPAARFSFSARWALGLSSSAVGGRSTMHLWGGVPLWSGGTSLYSSRRVLASKRCEASRSLRTRCQ
jgi:transcriptional regulator with XRE-family HTH domain